MTERTAHRADQVGATDRDGRDDRHDRHDRRSKDGQRSQDGQAGVAVLGAVLATVPGLALLVVGLAPARDGGSVRVPWLVAGALLLVLSWVLLTWRRGRARSAADERRVDEQWIDGRAAGGSRDGSGSTTADGSEAQRPEGAGDQSLPHPRLSARLAGRGSPEFVPPPLGGPGLSPDVDTRVLPAVDPRGSGGPASSSGGGRAGSPGWDAPPFDPTQRPAGEPIVLRADPVPASTPAPATTLVPGPAAAPSTTADAARPDEALAPPAWPAPVASGAVVFPSLAPVTRAAPAPTVPAGPAVVELSDGRVVELEGLVLVGRNPPALPGGNVLRVDDPARSVSKTHLLLSADEDGLWVVDRGSTNGTLVTLPDGQQIVCLPDRRVRLSAGSVVRFGASGFRVRRTGEPSA